MHTYNSNAIEGNTLSLQETRLVLEEGITIGGKSLIEHLEAANNAKAFSLLEDLTRDKDYFTHITILHIHDIVTKGILEDHGRYRMTNVRITGAVKSPPNYNKIPKLMDEMLDIVKEMKEHDVAVATYLNHRFVEIHPFSDGNGRVARLLTNLYLIKKGYPPIIMKKEDRGKYYDCLRKADLGDLNPFIKLISRAVAESLTIYLSMFGGEDELIPLKELAKTSSYSQDYLSLRARQGKLDAVKIGRVWHSTKKALKDYMER
ncbi:MAG: Fic family protein [Gammaproteobacteria bacterium]|nr:Fic family protein [Gammaproteobacteria bacterium]